jgi:ubiquitin C-terminal hydrolase
MPADAQSKGRGGIENIGNSCYMNSSIQVISRTLLGQKAQEIKNASVSQPILKAFQEMLKDLK